MLQPKDRAEYNRQQKLKEAPCYRVIADYPDNKDFPVGKIVTFRRWNNSTIYWEHVVKDCQGERSWLSGWFDQYPHIFQKINEEAPQAIPQTDVEGYDKDVEKRLLSMMEEKPQRLLMYFLSIVGREIVKINATDLELSQHMDIEGSRYKVKAECSIEPLASLRGKEEGELQPCCANSCDGFKCESGSVHLIDNPNKEERDYVASDNNSNGTAVASHTASSGNSMEQYLKRRIKELNEADAKFCHDRWDNPAADSFLKMLSREESNKVTFARQELETVLKMLNQ
jgi:hypothetical protein